MTELLERVIAQLKALPADEQNAIATMILDEIEDEAKWDITFASSQDTLAQLAAEAMLEYSTDKTQELDPEFL